MSFLFEVASTMIVQDWNYIFMKLYGKQQREKAFHEIPILVEILTN